MALFSSLSERFSHIFSKLTNRGKLTELEIKEAMREVKMALLEADVNYMVVKDFVKKVSEKAVGDEVMKSLTPSQQVIKIVNDELVALMSSDNQKITISSAPPTIIMMCGLQGAGKTTMCAKLGAYLKKSGKKSLRNAAPSTPRGEMNREPSRLSLPEADRGRAMTAWCRRSSSSSFQGLVRLWLLRCLSRS